MWQLLITTRSPRVGGGVNIAMVTQQTHSDSHKHAVSHTGGRRVNSARQHTRISVSAPQQPPRPSVTLSPYERQIVGAISGGPALERWRKWLPTGRHCWQHHTHFSLLRSLTRIILLSVWEVSISPLSFMKLHADLRLLSHLPCCMHLRAPHDLITALSR